MSFCLLLNTFLQITLHYRCLIYYLTTMYARKLRELLALSPARDFAFTHPNFIRSCAVVLFFTSGATTPPLDSRRVVLFMPLRFLNHITVAFPVNESHTKKYQAENGKSGVGVKN